MSSLNLHHVQDVGRILLEVGNDLKKLRETVKNNNDLDSLQSLISKAESDIKAKSDIVLNSLLDSTHYNIPNVTSSLNNNNNNTSKILKTRSLVENLHTKHTPKTQYENLKRHHLHRKINHLQQNNNNNNNNNNSNNNDNSNNNLISIKNSLTKLDEWYIFAAIDQLYYYNFALETASWELPNFAIEAAIPIQALFRGRKERKNIEKKKN